MYSENSKSFNITNGLKQHILVSLLIEHEELKKSNPQSQVIPPGENENQLKLLIALKKNRIHLNTSKFAPSYHFRDRSNRRFRCYLMQRSPADFLQQHQLHNQRSSYLYHHDQCSHHPNNAAIVEGNSSISILFGYLESLCVGDGHFVESFQSKYNVQMHTGDEFQDTAY